MIEKNFFDQPITNDIKTYENIKKLLLVKEMIMQLVVYYIIPTSKRIIR